MIVLNSVLEKVNRGLLSKFGGIYLTYPDRRSVQVSAHDQKLRDFVGDDAGQSLATALQERHLAETVAGVCEGGSVHLSHFWSARNYYYRVW